MVFSEKAEVVGLPLRNKDSAQERLATPKRLDAHLGDYSGRDLFISGESGTAQTARIGSNISHHLQV